MTDDLPQHLSFCSFKTKQNVSKSKLGGEFAKKGWKDFSNGFSEKFQERSLAKGEEPIKKKPKINPEVFKKQIFIEGCKTKQIKATIEYKEADFFTSKAEDFSSLIQKKSLQTENQRDLKTRNFNNCPNSVFLEVQNIRKKNSQINSEEFKNRIFTKGCKTKQRKPIIEHREADFFTSKAEDFCSLIQKKSLRAENQRDLKTRNFNNCPNSVFLEVQNIQDSFKQNISTLQPKFCLKSPNCNFISDLASKKANGQENVPSKSGCQFGFQENDFSQSVSVKKVQKTNVFSSLAKKNLTVNNNLSEPIADSSYSKKNNFRIKSSDCEKFSTNTRKVLWLDQNQNRNAPFNLSAFLEAECSANKGSSWLQSLQISDTEVAQEDAVGKKRIRNVLPGGFSEQMLKLQRIERSEEVFWDHNVDKNKKKGKYLALVLISVSSTGGIVIAKCLSLPTECSKGGMEADVKDGISTELKRVVVLLKKSVFNKLHLKAQSIFHLYPPWQTLHLPLTSCPVILCAKFIELNSSKEEVTQDSILCSHLISSSSTTSACHRVSNCVNETFHQWKEPVSFSGRIQRIWKVQTTHKNGLPFTSSPNHFRYSLLIQERNGVFSELLLSSSHLLPDFWEEFISEAEGKCYEFQDLHLVRRFCFNKHPQLFRVLDLLSRPQDDGNGLKQEFCYQLAFRGCSPIPEGVSDEGFPAYCPLSLQPLTSLFTEMTLQRFSCVVKIMFQFRKTLYLCDDSIPKYVRLESLFPVRFESPLIGSSVLIRDAQWLQGCLFLDNYSSLIELSQDFQIDERLKRRLGDRLNQLANVTLRNVIPSIDVTSENSMFVFIKGEIIGVDANNALSWLQCNLCWSDNLVQDSQLVIHCEDCFQVVLKPVLNVKMSVTCQCSPCVKVEVELLSKTIKRLLQISDNTHQPRCNIEDVLGKPMGPLLCWIRSSATVDDGKQFCASEVDTS